MLLRVVVSETDTTCLSVEAIPSNVEELYQVLRTSLGLRGGFILQFEDPDFNNQLCNLTDIKDLPVDRETLKVFLPCVSSGDSVEWPDPFPIPEISHNVELQLTEGNDQYTMDGSVMVISKGLKTDILDTLADSISKISAYPEREHYENVAKALVEKHPCLRKPGSEKGWYSWFHSLKFKLGNYRQKLSAAGCPEVTINKRKTGGSRGRCVKKPKKGEVNYCPDPPEGQNLERMEEKRKIMETAMQKKDPDHQLLEDLMVYTFSEQLISMASSVSRETGEYMMYSFQEILYPVMLTHNNVNCPIEKYVFCFLWDFDVAAVVEETIVLHNVKDVAHSFAMLMGVIYCVNLKYPEAMKYSFEILRYKL
uniref:PB1 domain-containing protein n=1 Tax=Cyprinodon variegatus TaxID=28743 RepID=A0A3Q2CZC9_CYPVA